MKQENLELENLLKEGLGDSKILALKWIGDDFIIDLILPSSLRISLRFIFITDLKIELYYGKYSGEPLLFDTIFEIKDIGYHIVFQFGAAPEGNITFECNNIVLEK